MSIGEGVVLALPGPSLALVRALRRRLRRYWPEIAAFVLMMAYTAVRTFFVAHGIDTVARTDWRIFLLLEVVFTVPYVWGIGDLVRGAVTGAHSKAREWAGIVGVVSGVAAPYLYLGLWGGLQHIQSAVITSVMVGLAIVGLERSLEKLRTTTLERRERESALEIG